MKNVIDMAGGYYIKKDNNTNFYDVYHKNSPISIGGFNEKGIYSNRNDEKLIIIFAKRHIMTVIPSFKRQCDKYLNSDFFVDEGYYREIDEI